MIKAKEELERRNLCEAIQQEARSLVKHGKNYRFIARPGMVNEYNCGKAVTLALIDTIQFEGGKLLDSGHNYKFTCEDPDTQMLMEFGGASNSAAERKEARKKWKAWKAHYSRK